jgi:hypothetical protein
MQPLSMRSYNFARCVACGEERRFLARGDEAILFGPRWLCVRCYFGYVRYRARSSVLFDQVSAEEVRAKVTLITEGHFHQSDNETEKDRCVRLLALEQLQLELRKGEMAHYWFHDFAFIKVVIADDLRLKPDSLFPRARGEAGGDDARKDAIITQVQKARVSHASELHASLKAKAICLAIGVIVVFVLYRAWK